MMLIQLMTMKRLPILYDLIQNEGLSLGTSCGINIAGAIRLR
jgi:cysteine synthase A